MKDILPSMPKGEIVGNMAIAEMTQTVKVVIDGNRLVIVIDDGNWLVGYGACTRDTGTQKLKHRR